MRAVDKLLALAIVLALGLASRLLPVFDDTPPSQAVSGPPDPAPAPAPADTVAEREALESR